MPSYEWKARWQPAKATGERLQIKFFFKSQKPVLRFSAFLYFSLVCISGGWGTDALARALPSDFSLRTEEIHTPWEGVTYHIYTFTSPRPLVVHLVKLDLRQPLRFAVCADTTETYREVRFLTVRACAERMGAQVAINGGFFDHTFWTRLQGKGRLLSLSVSEGKVLSKWARTTGKPRQYGINISKNNTVTFVDTVPGDKTFLASDPPVTWYNALSGQVRLLRNGQRATQSENMLHPQTAIATPKDKKSLWLIVVDGRQPGYSEGITYVELAELLKSLGAHDALALDGGGSSTLVLQDPSTRQLVVRNRPSDGLERPVGDSLVVFIPSTP